MCSEDAKYCVTIPARPIAFAGKMKGGYILSFTLLALQKTRGGKVTPKKERNCVMRITKALFKRFISLAVALVLALSAVVSVTAEGNTVNVYVTIADKGEIAMAKQLIEVEDINCDGIFTVDEVLYCAHREEGREYGSAMGDYGMYITSLWGDDSGNYGYWLNNSSCWSISDAVAENDYVVAFVYQNTEVWDYYSKFSKSEYTANKGSDIAVTLEHAGYDEFWNTVFSAHKGAEIKLYDGDFTELGSEDYTWTDNGDGSYSVKVNRDGSYTLVAYDNNTPIVPAVCTLAVTSNTDAAVAEVEAKIDAIGTVNGESRAAIEDARASYDALTEEQKLLVKNYDVLAAAEKALSEIDEDAQKAFSVEDMIARIGQVTIHSANRIKSARKAYDQLTENQKKLVSNCSLLVEAEIEIADLYKEASMADHRAIFEASGKYLSALGTPGVGSAGGEWMVLGLVRAGYEISSGYYKNAVDYVKENINGKEQLHRSKSTENSRMIIALSAAGYDVTNVGGHNLLYGITDMDYVKKQGINGPIWALIALDCRSYEIPQNDDAEDMVTREKLVAYILEKQLAEGGWALSGENADPDMTAMAIQALSPYYNSDERVNSAVNSALLRLSEMQGDNGLFVSIDGESMDSCAAIVIALASLGINPETDERFIKNGISVLDAMCVFALDDGSFAHIEGGKSDGASTENGLCALAAYYRFLDERAPLYDMSDVENATPDAGDMSNNLIFLVMAVLSAVAVMKALKRKH